MIMIPENIDYPKSIKEIITGRSTLDNWLNNHYPEFYIWLKSNFNGNNIKESIYMFFNNIETRPVCLSCGKHVKFHGYNYGFAEYCSPKCAQNDSTVREHYNIAVLKKYGQNAKKIFHNKAKQTCIERYGVDNAMKSDQFKEKAKQTCIERYGVDNAMKSDQFKEKAKQTCLKKYGNVYYLASKQHELIRDEVNEKMKNTNIKRYGFPSPVSSEKVKKRINETCMEKYGCLWNCMRKEAHNSNNINSNPNLYIRSLLDKYNINYDIEYPLSNYIYDFKVNNILIEVNPYATHNINWSPYKNVKISKNYHQEKTNAGKAAGFKVINIWDWDNAEQIILSLTEKVSIYARKCKIKCISKKDAKIFLSQYHFQGSCNNQSIIYGLYYNDELIQIMSFGKPRYNKKYEYELLRLCTKFGYKVLGGAQKLFNNFIKEYNPNTIVSYCDDSKFTGNIYNKLGFSIKTKPMPSRHWYKQKGNIHITDNLLRQKGYDKLFGTEYGKGTSNEELMLKNKFVEIYDAGQSTWVWENKIAQ